VHATRHAAASETRSGDSALDEDSVLDASDMLAHAPLNRPWTSSVLARSASCVQLQVMSRVAHESANRTSTSNTFKTTAQHFAQRRTTVPDEFHRPCTAQAQPQLRRARAQRAQRETVLLRDVKAMAKTLPPTVLSAGVGSPGSFKLPVGADSAVGREARGERRRLALQPNLDDSQSKVAAQLKVAIATTAESKVRFNSTARAPGAAPSESAWRFNVDKVMPPPTSENESLESFKVVKGSKTKFSRVDIAEALDFVKRRIPSTVLPPALCNAILACVAEVENMPRGRVSMKELRRCFPTFLHNRKEYNTDPVLNALETFLTNRHRYDMLHDSFLQYCDTEMRGRQRPTMYETRNVTSEPWANPNVRPSFDNALRRRHEENPNLGRLFDAQQLYCGD